MYVPTTINIETSCARPQGGRKAASPQVRNTRLGRARLCRDTWRRAERGSAATRGGFAARGSAATHGRGHKIACSARTYHD